MLDFFHSFPASGSYTYLQFCQQRLNTVGLVIIPGLGSGFLVM